MPDATVCVSYRVLLKKDERGSMNKKGRLVRRFAAVFLTGCILSGCGNDTVTGITAADSQNTEAEILSWFSEESVSVEYEVPSARSYICVDQTGYLTEAEKRVFCMGVMEEKSFSVVSAESGETVYTGALIKSEQKTTDGEFIFQGDFSELEIPGTYYITTEYLGRSYPFAIGDEVYDSGFEQALEELFQMDFIEDPMESCKVICTLLLAYEIYPQSFTEHSGEEEHKTVPHLLQDIRNAIEIMIACQNHMTGEVFEKPVEDLVADGGGDIDLTAMYSAMIAKFCFVYKEFDPIAATQYLAYADLGWQYLDKNQRLSEVETDILYYCATELYRVTGKAKYKESIQTELRKGLVEDQGDFPGAYFGNMTYLTTTRSVSLNECTNIMNSMTAKATKIASDSKDSPMYVRNPKDVQATMQDAMVLLFMIRCNDNYENNVLLQNQLHFLNGMNEENVSYFVNLGQVTADESWNRTPYGISQMILLYSALAGVQS